MLKGSKKFTYDRKATKYTNKDIAMCLINEVREKLRLKIRKALVTLEERVM